MFLHIRSPTAQVVARKVNIRHQILKTASFVTETLEIGLSQRINGVRILGRDEFAYA